MKTLLGRLADAASSCFGELYGPYIPYSNAMHSMGIVFELPLVVLDDLANGRGDVVHRLQRLKEAGVTKDCGITAREADISDQLPTTRFASV